MPDHHVLPHDDGAADDRRVAQFGVTGRAGSPRRPCRRATRSAPFSRLSSTSRCTMTAWRRSSSNSSSIRISSGSTRVTRNSDRTNATRSPHVATVTPPRNAMKCAVRARVPARISVRPPNPPAQITGETHMAEHMAELHSEGRATFAGLVTDGQARLDRIFQAVAGTGRTRRRHRVRASACPSHARSADAGGGRAGRDHRRRCTDTPLTVHTRTGLASGLTPAEIGEIVTETAASPGFRVRSPLLAGCRTVRRFADSA